MVRRRRLQRLWSNPTETARRGRPRDQTEEARRDHVALLDANRAWVVVLAGGDGERLRPFAERWLGRHVPKQYCTFVGTRSMLEHTLDRALEMSPPRRIITVMARSHAGLSIREHPALAKGRVVMQPANRDTAPGVFLALTYVCGVDPDAMVVIFPSDHFIHPEDVFVRQVREALLSAGALDRVMLLGVEPQGLELDYGWIQRGRLLDDRGARCHAVEMFVEKPPKALAEALQASGAMWNTMVLAGSVRRLSMLGCRHLPDIMARFQILSNAIGTGQETEVLDRIYDEMPRRNFSADLLQRTVDDLAVVKLQGVSWSDWGTADRIAATIHGLGKRPAFAVPRKTGQDARDGVAKALPGAA